MNILHLLKNRAGEISKVGLLGLAVTAGMGGLSIYNYVTSSPAAQEQKIRSLASIMNSGGEMPREYQSMNFSMGNNQFASAEERAQMEGQMADQVFNGGEDAVNAVEGLNFGPNGTIDGVGGIQGSALGAGEAGLGMGANEVAELAGNGRARGAAQKGSTEGVDAAAAAQGQKNKLQRAAINYKGGSNLGSGKSLGGGNSGSTAGAGRLASSARTEGQSRIGANSITGAMGGDGPLVKASPKFQGAHSSSFVSGSRYGRTGTGINSEEGNSLAWIARQSSKVAANRNRAANEGSSPFMADTKLAAGITVDGMETSTSFGAMGDDSFDKGLDKKIGDMGAAVDEVDTTEQEKKAHRTRLLKMMAALLVTTTLMAPFIYMKTKVPVTAWLGWLLYGVLVALIGVFIADAISFGVKYKDQWWESLIYSVVGLGMITILTLAAACGPTSKMGYIMTKMYSFLFKSTGGQAILGILGSTATGMAVDGTVESVSAWSKEGFDGSKLKNGK